MKKLWISLTNKRKANRLYISIHGCVNTVEVGNPKDKIGVLKIKVILQSVKVISLNNYMLSVVGW